MKVFISAKSQDYSHARVVYDFLRKHGFDCFLSDRSLPETGSTDYHREIEHALRDAQQLVVVTSSGQNVESKWVEFEWRAFHNQILSGEKTNANIVTIVAGGCSTRDLPLTLRQFEVRLLDESGLLWLREFLGRQSKRDSATAKLSKKIEETRSQISRLTAELQTLDQAGLAPDEAINPRELLEFLESREIEITDPDQRAQLDTFVEALKSADPETLTPLKLTVYRESLKQQIEEANSNLLAMQAMDTKTVPEDEGLDALRAAVEERIRRGHWETAAMGLEELRVRGEAIAVYAPKLAMCFLNAHEVLHDKDEARIKHLIEDLEKDGQSKLASELLDKLLIKRKASRRGWFGWR